MFNLERLAVKKWQRERGTTKKKRRKRWRSGTSKSHPKKYPEWREAKGRVVLSGLVLWTFGVFSCRALTLYFLRKEGGIAEQKPQAKTPTNPRHLRTDPA